MKNSLLLLLLSTLPLSAFAQNFDHNYLEEGPESYNTAGSISVFALPEDVTLSKVEDRMFEVKHLSLFSDTHVTESYDQVFYEQFSKTLKLAKERNGILFLKSTPFGTDRYNLNIASIELPADDVIITKIAPTLIAANKIVIRTKKNLTHIGGICFGCSTTEMDKVIARLQKNINEAILAKKNVSINLGYTSYHAIEAVNDAIIAGSRITQMKAKMIPEGKSELEAVECGWTFVADLKVNPFTLERTGIPLLTVCLDKSKSDRLALAQAKSQSKALFSKILKKARDKNLYVRFQDGLHSNNIALTLGLSADQVKPEVAKED